MLEVISVTNMRKSDANTIELGTSGRELMLRAGKGIYETIIPYVEENSSIAIVCGSGNNAGDGYVLANLLSKNNILCSVFLCQNRFSEDGKYYYEECQRGDIPIFDFENNKDELCKYNIIIDCILGTGFKGQPRPLVKEAINYINLLKEKDNSVFVISVDINSGLNGDNGLYDVCISSDLTISIGYYMPGLFLNKAKDVIKNKVNIDIGIKAVDKPYYLFEASDVKRCLKDRKNYSNKGTYGYIGLIGGSMEYSGAIRLAAMSQAAMRAGAGVAMIAAPKSICQYIIPNILESTIYPLNDDGSRIVFDEELLANFVKKLKVISFGMGIGISDDIKRTLRYILDNFSGILIIDADGLNCLAQMEADVLKNAKCQNIILTPHIKEFTRLSSNSSSEIIENPIELSVKYANDNNVILLLKGPTTIITDGDKVLLVDKGCPGMATAGSGDVLSGILAAICAYNSEDVINACASGAYINGASGELAQEKYGAISMTAGDTVSCIPAVIKNLI